MMPIWTATPWYELTDREQSLLASMAFACLNLANLFWEKGMKPRQVVISGEVFAAGLTALFGLPVGWIGTHVVPRERGWSLEMLGDDFAYGSMVIDADGEYRIDWEPKRQWLLDRERDVVMKDVMDRLAGRLRQTINANP